MPNLAGQKFGRWLVTEPAGRDRHRHSLWKCRCECGTVRVVSQGNLITGDSHSCGCLHLEHIHASRFRHGRNTKDPSYMSWAAMRARCQTPGNWKYPSYGAVGVKVCSRWNDFATFLSDMGERPQGKTLDRFPDPSGNYEPTNCRWATPKEQRANQRKAVTK